MVTRKKRPEDVKELSLENRWKEAFQTEETAGAKSRDLVGCLACPKITKDAMCCGDRNRHRAGEEAALEMFQRWGPLPRYRRPLPSYQLSALLRALCPLGKLFGWLVFDQWQHFQFKVASCEVLAKTLPCEILTKKKNEDKNFKTDLKNKTIISQVFSYSRDQLEVLWVIATAGPMH